jgi:hypothetical protein
MEGMAGNHTAAARAGLRIDSFDPPVPRAVRLEGAGFYLHRRVSLVVVEQRRVRAIVRGARAFDVTVTADEGGASVACDCQGFRAGQQVCRHVWATLIKIQNEGLLPAPTGTPATAGSI